VCLSFSPLQVKGLRYFGPTHFFQESQQRSDDQTTAEENELSHADQYCSFPIIFLEIALRKIGFALLFLREG